MASLSFFPFRPHVPSRCWKGLGQQESMAQKTPHVSTSQWQITVPSPEQHFFFKASRSVFLTPLKEGGLAIEGKEQWTFGFRKPLSSQEAPTYVKRGIVHNGWYAHLFQFNAGTGTEAHAGRKAANTHKYFHKEKSQMAGLNSSAQFRRARSECTS